MYGLFIATIILYLVHIYIISTRSLHMLQQNRYNRGYRYIKWIIRNIKENLLSFYMVLILIIMFIFNESIDDYTPYLFIIIYTFLTYAFISERKRNKTKLPLKYTARIKRLMVTEYIIYIIPILYMLITFGNYPLSLFYLILGIMSLLNHFIILLCNFLNHPIEHAVSKHFEKMAKDKLKSMNNMEVIGITGSYGKTSTKNIVNDILSSKYNVYKTPSNFNTPYGLMITINEHLDKYNDYFIAEMGACKVGDIKELCDLVHPKYGILTKIGLAHLETFGSEKNIEDTKFELIENLPSDGLGILNGDDEKQLNHIIKNNCQIKWIGIDNTNVDCYAKDLKLSPKGTIFKVVFKDLKEEYEFSTKLLGRNNIYNILAGIVLGKELGIDISKLQRGVKMVEPVDHRLSLTKYYDITLIDDAYNSNPSGAKMALEVLKMMPGKHIIVTPGMIEVGSREEEVNKEFGRQIADNVDEAILIGEEKTKPIYEGLIEKKFPKEHIHVLNDVLDAFPLMMKLKDKETYALLENDLPDSFSEKIRSDKK